MRPAWLWLAAASVLAAADGVPRPAAPQINVGGVVNAATNRPAPDNYVSPGAIISIYGTGLAKVTHEVSSGDLDQGFLPEVMSGVTVFFGSVAAPLFFVSPLQINAQAPANLQPGQWQVTVRVDRLEASDTVMVAPYSPGLFSVARHADGTQVSQQAPARPGEFILFFGTGFGETRPPMLSGQLAPPGPTWMANHIEARIGGQALAGADIYYYGLAPAYAGLYQFNLRVPAATPGGDADVMVRVADSWSQPGVKIAVKP